LILIYSARNTLNDKIYIGQTQDFKRRKWEHRCTEGKRTAFANAIKAYGFDVFEFKVLFKAENTGEADELERFLIAALKTQDHRFGYNLARGGKVNRGWKASKAVRRRMRAGQLGKKIPLRVRKRISLGMKRWYLKSKKGRRHRKTLQKSMRGNSYALGYKHTKNARSRISASLLGNKRFPNKRGYHGRFTA